MPFSLHNAAASNDLNRVKSLLKEITEGQRHEKELHYTDETGSTPMHHAAHNGNIEMLQCLFDAGCDSNATVPLIGFSPLHIALHSKESGLDVIEWLVANNADITAQDNLGRTALHQAFYADKPESVCYLLKQGMDITIKDNDNTFPAERATDECLQNVIKLLKNQRRSQSSLRNLTSNALFKDEKSLELLVDLQENWQGRQALLDRHRESPCLTEEARQTFEERNWLRRLVFEDALKTNLTQDEVVFDKQEFHTNKALIEHLHALVEKVFPAPNAADALIR